MYSVRNMIYAACSAAFFLAACTKEKDETSGVYVSANVAVYDSVKMYTKFGVITDTMIIHEALSRRWDNVKFNLKAGMDSVKKDMTVNIDPEGGNSYIDFKTSKKSFDIAANGNGITILMTKDSLTEMSIGAPFPTGTVYGCLTASELIGKYRPSFTYAYDEGTNTYYRTARRYAVLEESGGYLTYPRINFIHTNRDATGRGCISVNRDLNNQFDETIPAALSERDTLIVQVNRLRLIKQ